MFQSPSVSPVSELRPWSPPSQHLRLLRGRPKVAVLLNANAKRVNERVRRELGKLVAEDHLYFSRSIEDARAICDRIIRERYDVVMAGGGDGTIMTAMNLLIRAADSQASGLYRPPLPDLGVLRLGTGNGLAAATGAGMPLADVARALSGESPPARPLPLVEDQSDHFVTTFSSLGYDAQLLNDYLDSCNAATSKLGKNAAKSLPGYFYALFTRTVPQQLRTPHAAVRVEALGRASVLDPETEEEIPLEPNSQLFNGVARTVAWGTTPYYGFKMMIFPFAERRSDRFHLRISTASIPYLLSHLPSLWNGTLRSPFVDFLVEGARISSDQPLPYQTGGDGRGYREQVEVRLSERTFRVLDESKKRALA